MKPIEVLHEYLDLHFPSTVQPQEKCTCGAGNHVRIQFFRVEGQPATVVFPEGAVVSCDLLRMVLGTPRVEPLNEKELDTIYSETELGHMQPFENPFGANVFLDASLLNNRELVFCPRMFFGQQGRDCFRAPLQEFVKLTRAQVVQISAPAPATADAWGV